MEELGAQLTRDFSATMAVLTSQKKDQTKIDNAYKEYVKLDRSIRTTQIDNTQKDKTVGTGANSKLVEAVRIIVNYQKEIVTKSVAFEVGEPATILPNAQTELSDFVLKLWKDCRIDYKLQEAITLKKSETECAFMFHFHTNDDNTRTIKLKILSHEKGVMSPHFDEFGDMDAFTWEFVSVVNKKNINNIWIFDKTMVYKYSDANESMSLVSDPEAHGFSKIPIVYMEQANTEWFDVEKIIDRYETSISRLVESNDYSGHPILALFGKIKSMPERDNSGKTLNFPIETTDDGKPVQGDAKFITHDNAPESVKLELDTFDNLIYSLSQTPNISFNNLKGMGAISGIAIKFMFLDSILKAKSNEGENRTIIERCLNILTDGIINTLKTALKNQAIDLSWSISFNSILPNDISMLITDLSSGVESKIISRETAVKELNLTDDSEKELQTINDENESKTV